MNPQLNKVFSKLAKADNFTKLASQKVELGLVDDLDKNSAQVNDSLREIEPLLKEIANTKKLISKTDKEYSSLIKDRDKAKSTFEKAQNEAKKLEMNFDGLRASTNRKLEDLRDYQSGLKKEEKQFNKLKGQADKTLSRIKKNLEKAKKAEKDLGIKIPALSKYQKSADLLDKLMRNA
mgnify:FL=1